MAWRILLDSLKDSTGYYDALNALIYSQLEREQLYNLEEGDPVIDQMLDILYSEVQAITSKLDEKKRQKVFIILKRMCKKHGKWPSSLVIRDGIELQGSHAWDGSRTSDVWKAQYNGMFVAVKAMRIYKHQGGVGGNGSGSGTSDKLKQRFCREAMVWKQFSHPNLVPFLGINETLFNLALISEWMEHGRILDFVKSTPETNRLKLLYDVSSGLEYLHTFPFVHSDLKGPNILIDNGPTARICDFGLTDIMATASMSVGTPPSGGTHRWMAPELFTLGQQSTKETDIYAFGMVAYEVFSGSVPFGSYSDLQAIKAITGGERPGRPPRRELLGLDDEVWNIIQRCWDKEKEARPPIVDVRSFFETRHGNWTAPTPEVIDSLNLDSLEIDSDNATEDWSSQPEGSNGNGD